MEKTTISQLEHRFASFLFFTLGRETEMVNERRDKGKRWSKRGRQEHLGSVGDQGGSQLSKFPSCSTDLQCAREWTMGMTLQLPRSGAGSLCSTMIVWPDIALISHCIWKELQSILSPVRVGSFHTLDNVN